MSKIDKNVNNDVLKEYGIDITDVQLDPINQGLINSTWKVKTRENAWYILQKLNDQVFSNPIDIDHNINLIADHLSEHYPEYLFVKTIKSKEGKSLLYKKGIGHFRMFPYVTGSHSKNIVQSSEQAYEAAVQFGRFTNVLRKFDVTQLRHTIPSFHDLSLRFKQFSDALTFGNPERLAKSAVLIAQIKNWQSVVKEYEKIKTLASFKLRVTHHDTKISNVLFDDHDKGICVIDLDTIMPGYFISDIGDMMRTYLSSANEEESDINKIDVRPDIYKAIVTGYMEEMRDELTYLEKQYFFYAGIFMIYMQALRFLTDYLNDDLYYDITYPDQNFVRAKNQMILLQRLSELKSELSHFM